MDNLLVDIICGQNRRSNCTVMLEHVTCDGHAENKTIGVFSHFHEDHIGSILDCIGSYDVLLTHNTTFDAIVALKPGMRLRQQWTPQQYGTEYHDHGTKIQLIKANHIPGSSQVYVENDRASMLYSGDFSYPGVQIKKAEYLVLDATHGDPSFDGRTDRGSVLNRLLDDVKDRTSRGKSVVIRTSGGTLQEIARHFEMSYVDKIDDGVSFVMDAKQKRILDSIYPSEKKEFRDAVEYKSPEFWRLLRENKPCVIFTTSNILDDDLTGIYSVIIDQYRFDKDNGPIIPYETGSGSGCRYNLAAHASIENIYSYVEAVDPRYVVTDYSRSKYAPKLARLIEQRFAGKIKATYRPVWG